MKQLTAIQLRSLAREARRSQAEDLTDRILFDIYEAAKKGEMSYSVRDKKKTDILDDKFEELGIELIEETRNLSDTITEQYLVFNWSGVEYKPPKRPWYK